jgi:hypothetical protein
MTSQTTAKTAPVDLRPLLRATPVDLRKPISAWAASTHVGKPSNYGRGKYLMSVLVQGRHQCTMSPSTIVRTLRMSSWCLGQRLFWVLQEVSGHCIYAYGHDETRNRSCGCIVRASWRLITCELSYLCQENPSPRPIFGQRVLGQIRRTTRVMRSKPLASPCSMTTRYVYHAYKLPL